MAVNVNLGCWKRYIPGWVHVDLCDMPHIDHKSRVDDLPFFADASVDLLYASHVLEYFDRVEAEERVLKEWRRVLKPGGVLRLAVPEIDKLIEVYKRSGELRYLLGPMYGRMPIETETGPMTLYHKTVYNLPHLTELLEKSGFANVRRYDWQQTIHKDHDDHSQAYFPHMDKDNGILISLNVEADAV